MLKAIVGALMDVLDFFVVVFLPLFLVFLLAVLILMSIPAVLGW